MKREFSAGGIVFNNQGQVLLTQHSSNKYWGFPKGLIEPGTSSQDAALREVKEEGGIEAEIIGKVGDSKYVYTKDGDKIFKMVILFLMKYKAGDVKNHDWEVSESSWFEPKEATEKLSFSQDRQLLEKALSMWHTKHD